MRAHSLPLPGVIRTVREARFGAARTCVHCGAASAIKWGGFSGRQRYRCRVCRRTFSDLTKTAFAYTKKTAQWPDYIACVRRSDTLRAAARDLSIHVSTAFRWRHRILTALRATDPVMLRGVVELKELSFAVSEKGTRAIEEPRSRGMGEVGRGWHWYLLEHDRVVVARSREGIVFSATVGRDATPSHALRRLLMPRLAGQCTCYGRAPRAGSFGVLRSGGHSYESLRTTLPLAERDPKHLMNVDAYARRLIGWIERFRGVASRYRDNYLLWHRVVDPDNSPLWIQAVILSSCGAPTPSRPRI